MFLFRGVSERVVRIACVWLILFPAVAAGQSVDLAKVVPEDTLIYVGWAGRNHTKVAAKDTALGKTLDDPQVRHFVDAALSAIDTAIKEKALSPAQHPVYESGKRILNALHRNPTAFILINADMSEEGPIVNAALLSYLGEEAAAFVREVDQLMAFAGLRNPGEKPANNETLRQLVLPLPIGVYYGAVDGYFLLTIGKETASILTPYLSGGGNALAASKSLTRCRTKIGGDDKTRAISVYLNAAKIIERIEKLLPMITGGNPGSMGRYNSFMDNSGYGALQSVAWEMHHKGGGCYNGVYVHTDGKATGLLGMYANEPLTDKELALIPKDVHWAKALRIGSGKWFEILVNFITSVMPEEKDEFLEGLAEVEEELGFRLGDDFLNLINDSLIVFDAPEDGGFFVTGIKVMFKSSDAQRFRQSLHKIAEWIAQEVEDDASVKIKSVTHRKHLIEFLNITGAPMPVAPAWASHEDWIIVSLYPQMVRNAIDRFLDSDAKKDSILANADFLKARKELGAIGTAMQYSNTKRGAEDMYALLLPLAQTGLAMSQGEGITMDISSLPSRRALTQHLFSDLWTSRVDDEGLLFAWYGPLPVPIPAFSGSGSVGGIALLISILLPSLSRARELSKRLVSASNLKGIGTSCFLYAYDHEEQFPPSLQSLVDSGELSHKQLESPKHEAGVGCYVYLPGQATTSDRRNILAHERVELNGGEGVNALFVDGHVEFLRMPRFEQLLRETQERLEQD